jgi:hypothetical protein
MTVVSGRLGVPSEQRLTRPWLAIAPEEALRTRLALRSTMAALLEGCREVYKCANKSVTALGRRGIPGESAQ